MVTYTQIYTASHSATPSHLQIRRSTIAQPHTPKQFPPGHQPVHRTRGDPTFLAESCPRPLIHNREQADPGRTLDAGLEFYQVARLALPGSQPQLRGKPHIDWPQFLTEIMVQYQQDAESADTRPASGVSFSDT